LIRETFLGVLLVISTLGTLVELPNNKKTSAGAQFLWYASEVPMPMNTIHRSLATVSLMGPNSIPVSGVIQMYNILSIMCHIRIKSIIYCTLYYNL
jgi:hypothetical protein